MAIPDPNPPGVSTDNNDAINTSLIDRTSLTAGPLANNDNRYDDYYNDNNLIGAGNDNEIINSRRCSIIQGSNNYISGKYNCHIIGDYIGIEGVTDVEDNSFNVGCYRGMNVWGQMTVKRGGATINGDMLVSGNISATGDVVAFVTSDGRLKDDQSPISGSLQKISTLDPVEFNWSEKQSTYVGHDIGLIAQQVQAIAPEIVTERPDGYLAMKYDKMVPLLVGAIQDQQKIIDEMRAELDEIKSKINC
tara:strand:+ start:19087 stop:19830 length:744 start_codon:yes stop_codon:yes gene_type:complete